MTEVSVRLSWQKIAQIEVKLLRMPWGLHFIMRAKGTKDMTKRMYEEKLRSKIKDTTLQISR